MQIFHPNAGKSNLQDVLTSDYSSSANSQRAMLIVAFAIVKVDFTCHGHKWNGQ